MGRGRVVAVLSAAVVTVMPASAARAQTASPCGDPGGKPWCDTSLDAPARAALLVKAMTQDEEIAELSGVTADGHTGATAAIPRLGVPKSFHTDGPVGVRQGKSTALPAPMAEAATFDPAMAKLHGTVIGNEARAKGNDSILGPTVNIMRTPLGGRTFEAFGEDPWLTSRMAVGWIEGAQSQGVFATVKHFAANNQEGSDPTGRLSSASLPFGFGTDNARYYQDSIVDERALREVEFPAFEAAVKEAKVGSVMCSYNRVNGPWACASKHLLDDVLRKDWGFDGLISSDYVFATHAFDTANHLNAGMDLEMPNADAYTPALVQAALASGQVSKATLDARMRAAFTTLFRVGFFDRPETRADAPFDVDGHAKASQDIAESAMTLLRNENATLPLDASKLKTLAVIGPQATKFVTGGGSGDVDPPVTISALQGITDRVGPGVQVKYDDGSDAARAAALAKGSDAAIVVVGDYQTEGADKSCLTLECPASGTDQDALVAAVGAAQPKTVAVLETGGPVLTPWREQVGALLEAWYPGDHGGRALARVLFGDVDPGGRLPATFPANPAQEQVAGDRRKYPGTADQRTFYSEGVFNGYRWFDARGFVPAYAFGDGLSYTTFSYGAPKRTAGGVSFAVTNTGARTGIAVPQLYVEAPSSDDVPQPPRKLAGFTKLTLAPGKSKTVTIPIAERSLQHWDDKTSTWQPDAGCIGLAVGRSSRDITGATSTCAPVGATSAKACASRRVVVVKHLGIAKARVRRVEISVNGKRHGTLRGKRSSVRIVLTGLPKGTARVTIVVRPVKGKPKRLSKRYRTCTAGSAKKAA